MKAVPRTNDHSDEEVSIIKKAHWSGFHKPKALRNEGVSIIRKTLWRKISVLIKFIRFNAK